MAKKLLNTTDVIVDDFDIYEVDELIETLQDYKKEYGDKYTLLYLDKVEYHYPYDSGTYIKYSLKGIRPETEEEYKARKATEKQKSEAEKNRELQLLQELKKKYEV
jgi:hypothetical protein